MGGIRQKKPLPPLPSVDGQAWLEIDTNALAGNAAKLRSMLPPGCELMAVVKANAYGHGDAEVAKRLQQEGVTSFAVVSVLEGVRLRQNNLSGSILVLGYTHPMDAAFLNQYNLSQAVVDANHASELEKTGHKISIHIAVDTGLHRLGVKHNEILEIESIFACKNLKVEGIASHFASPDSVKPHDVEFTNRQISSFIDTINALTSKGCDVGKRHIMASYGLKNYPESTFDYARIGIALYGTNKAFGLTPVMSVRARVARVVEISKGDSVSYGRRFTANRPTKIATICIGYSAGIPRQISEKNGEIIIHGKKAPIVGTVCMDMLMADVTDVGEIKQGDIATIIGKDGNETIRCEEYADKCGTISHEILCGLGANLPRIVM